MNKTHRLKTLTPAFEAVRSGIKCFEFRPNDRGFDEGDVIVLCDWNVDIGDFTGREEQVRVTYMLTGPDYGIPVGYACMSIRRLSEERFAREEFTKRKKRR